MTDSTPDSEAANSDAPEVTLACGQCAADLKFEPGADALECPYCKHINPIDVSTEVVEELDFQDALAEAESGEELREVLTVRCDGCGAQVEFGENVTVQDCPYCGDTLVAQQESQRLIKPRSLLPFKITRDTARGRFSGWIKSLWFAPNALKKLASVEGKLHGIYVPYWTYDSDASTRYTGQRGEHYWVTEHYTATENGKTVQRTRRVRKTRWYPASGKVHNRFDDVLVLASQRIPRKTARKLEPWDLEDLTPFQEEFLSGFVAEAYTVDLENGFQTAQGRMEPTITATIHQDIGGDVQRIHTRSSRFYDITFKHILLPLWISSYRYKQKLFHFFVNARTGEVQGERPWSWIKITLTALTAIGAIAGVAWFANS